MAGKVYGIFTKDGVPLHAIVFVDPRVARSFMEGFGEQVWRETIREEGLTEAHIPTVEWRQVDPPEWAAQDAPAWAGYMEDDIEDPAIVAAFGLEERSWRAIEDDARGEGL